MGGAMCYTGFVSLSKPHKNPQWRSARQSASPPLKVWIFVCFGGRMGLSAFSRRLFRIRLFIFEVCETVVFAALVVFLAIYTIMHMIEFGRHLL